MALEDFFTLTEMKDGLTVRARVEELVTVMNKEKDCVVKHVGDAMRQWSTVASVIAVTENEDCLDLFIQLDGLLFIDRWIKNAQKFSADASDCFIEESILALLHTLEKLKIDNEKLTSSGICFTLRDLLSHRNSKIQDKAKSVVGNLKLPSVSGAVKLDSEEAQDICDSRIESGNMLAGEIDTPISSSAISPNQKTDIDKHVHQFVGDNAASSGCCVDQQSEGSEAVVKEPDKVTSHYPESDLKEVRDKLGSSVRKEACSSEQKSVRDCADTEQGTDFKKEGRRLEYLSEVVNAEIHNESLPNKLGNSEVYTASIMPKPVETSSSLDKNNVLETREKAVMGTDNHVDSSTMKSKSADLHTGGNSSRGGDSGVLMNCTVTLARKASNQCDESCTKTLRDSHVDGSMLGKSKDLGNIYPQTEKLSSTDQVAERIKHNSRHLRDSSLFESSRGRKSVDVTSKMSAMDFEYGTVDALEVACLVAKEVERQVIEDYDEQFGSFSRKSTRGTPLHLAGSPDSCNGENVQHADGSPFHESPVEKMSDEDSPGEGESSSDSDDMDAERENCMKVAESPQVTDMAPEAAISAEKDTSEIDLNLEFCSEAEDDAGNSVSNPVAVISASRAVAVPGLPASPLKFEGDLGWKGSAATSAFRPAFPRRNSDGDRTIFVEEPADAREGHDFLIDLNLLAEDGDVKTINPISSKQNLTISGAPGESLVEQSPRRFEKLSFDLNQMSEDGDAPFSSSPPSSSSLKPAMRNFDLNDRPLNFGDPSDLQPCLATFSSQKAAAHGGSSGESVISIMGAKVKKNAFVHQAPFSFFNGGRASEPVVDSSLGRSGPPHYAPPPIYSYNGIPMRPPTMQYFHPMYGPGVSAAQMLDSRVSMVPQFMGAPPSSFQASYAHQPSFTPTMMGPLPGPNGASSSRPHPNFNPGFVLEGANRVDPGGFRQFIAGQVRAAEDHNTLQPLFPGIVGGKRKEPDGGWEPYVTNYKHHQPPHL